MIGPPTTWQRLRRRWMWRRPVADWISDVVYGSVELGAPDQRGVTKHPPLTVAAPGGAQFLQPLGGVAQDQPRGDGVQHGR